MIKEHIMKRYTLGLVVGSIALISFIMYKSPTMTAPQGGYPLEKDKPSPFPSTLPVPPKPTIKNLQAVSLTVNNETGKDIFVQGSFSLISPKAGSPATLSKKGEKITIAKNEKSKKITINPITGFDRVEISFFEANGSPLRSVNSIIHRADSPSSPQTVTVK